MFSNHANVFFRKNSNFSKFFKNSSETICLKASLRDNVMYMPKTAGILKIIVQNSYKTMNLALNGTFIFTRNEIFLHGKEENYNRNCR